MDIKSFFRGKDAVNFIDENQQKKLDEFKNKQQKELHEFRNKQAMDYINNANELISYYNKETDKLEENKIIKMLNIADFVNSGSNKQNDISKKFNNCHFSNVLEKMALEKKIKVIKFDSNKHKYYYTRLTDTDVENMSESDIKLRLWQNIYNFTQDIAEHAPLMDKRVEIHGTNRTDMNGKRGVAVDFHWHEEDQGKRRYTVQLDGGPAVKLKPANLREFVIK